MIRIRLLDLGMAALSAALLAVLPAALAARAKHHPTAAAPAAPKAESGPAQRLGEAESWTAYRGQDATGRVCYLVGVPERSEPAGFPRKSPMAMVTHRPTEKIANVVSFVEGYPIKEGSEVSVDIGGSKFELFTKDDSAWARTSDIDRAIVAALAKAKQVVVRGVPQKGAPTTDIYRLAGFPKALAMIDKACGVKR